MLPEKGLSTYGTLGELSEDFSVSQQYLRRLIASGELPAYRLGKRQIRIKRADVEALLKPIPAAS